MLRDSEEMGLNIAVWKKTIHVADPKKLEQKTLLLYNFL